MTPGRSSTIDTLRILEPEPDTLAALAPRYLRWLQYVRERRPATLTVYRQILEDFVVFTQRAGLLRPAQITAAHIEGYVAALRTQRGVAASTANRSVIALRGLWAYLQREGLATTSPPGQTFLLKTPRVRLPRYLRIEEQDRVLKALASDSTPEGQRDAVVIGLMLCAGLRISEVCALRVAEISLTGQEPRLRVVGGKGQVDREVPIVAPLDGLLRAYLAGGRRRLVRTVKGAIEAAGPGRWVLRFYVEGRRRRVVTGTEAQARAQLAALAPQLGRDTGWLVVRAGGAILTGAGRPLSPRAVFEIVRRRLTALLGFAVHPHALRHSFASRLHERGANVAFIARLLGHAKLDTTAVYTHLPSSATHAQLAACFS